MASRATLLAGYLVTLSSTAGLLGCNPGTATEEKSEPAKPTPVEVADVRRGDISALYTGTASVEADAEAQVVAKIAGEVIEILVEEGARVVRNQPMARLDGDRLKLELARNRANLDKLNADFERQTQLLERGLISKEVLEALRFDIDATRAAHDLAALEYSYKEIRAPIDGVVAERFIKVGNTIAVNTPAFHLVDRDPLIAYLHVPEKDFPKISVGLRGDMQVDAQPGQRFAAHVERISPVMNAETGTFKVTLQIQDPTDVLRPGMFGRFAIVYEDRPKALLIPRAALMDTGSGNAVYIVEDSKATRRDVSVGFTAGEQVEVLDGLQEGDVVVTIGQSGLKSGNAVEVVDPNQST